MAKKLEKLDHIDAHLHAVDQEIKELKHSLTFLHDTMAEIKNKQDAQEVQLDKLEKEVAEVKGVNAKLEREIVDIRARSMRSNLIFYNVPEEAHENPEQVVRSVITKMGIEDGKDIEMERIHRMGKQSRPSPSHGTRVQETSQTSRPRPIIVKFLRYQDKENIRKAAHKLKGTNIGIGEQFPKPIYDARRRLYPIMRQAKLQGQKASMVLDKLYINGQLYKE